MVTPLDPRDVRVVMFDYDGTLCDSMNPDIPGTKPYAFARAVVEFHPGLAGREAEIAGLYFATSGWNRVRQLRHVEERLGVGQIAAEKEGAWSAAFDAGFTYESWHLFPDAVSTVRSLAREGYAVGIGSSIPSEVLATIVKPELREVMEFVLGNEVWDRRETGKKATFVKGVGYAAFVCGKYDLTPAQVAYVGDTPEDMVSALEGGMFAVGKSDSRIPGRADALREAGADRVVGDLVELLDIFGVRRE